ncbi:MAG: DUF2490 domain-containing protein [Ferruginibacter sp.]
MIVLRSFNDGLAKRNCFYHIFAIYMKLPHIFLLILLSLSIGKISSAQKNLGSWNTAIIKLGFAKKWTLVSELQLRSLHTFNYYYYQGYQTAIQFKLNNSVSFMAGIGKYDTYSDGGNFKTPIVTDEKRIWEQITFLQMINRIKLEHRYRVEQRFGSFGYRNRFKYRLNCVIPVNHIRLDAHTWYAYGNEELFFFDKAPYFESNRLGAGVGYQLNKNIALQTGLFHVFNYKINSKTSKDFLQLTLLYEQAWRKKAQVLKPVSSP